MLQSFQQTTNDRKHMIHDSVTGAYSRAVFQEQLVAEMNRARQYSLPLALLVVDIDHFKSINDAFGHARGAQVWRWFVSCAHALMRHSDLLYRYGGDEFILLLPGTNDQQAIQIAERLLEGVRAYIFSGNPPLSLTLSIGCASFPESGQTAEQLFERAD